MYRHASTIWYLGEAKPSHTVAVKAFSNIPSHSLGSQQSYTIHVGRRGSRGRQQRPTAALTTAGVAIVLGSTTIPFMQRDLQKQLNIGLADSAERQKHGLDVGDEMVRKSRCC